MATAHHARNRFTRGRRSRHGHAVALGCRHAQVHVFEQQLGREGHLVKRQVGQHRGFVAGVHRAQHRVVDAFQEHVARNTGFFSQHRDLAQVLNDHAKHGVVCNLPDPRQLALADPHHLAGHRLQEGFDLVIQGFRAA